MKLLNYLFCDIFGSVLECYELTHISWLSSPGNHAWLNRHCYPIGCVIKSTHQGMCSCSPIVNFFKFTFHHGMATSVIFLINKANLRDLIAATGLVISNWIQIVNFSACVTVKFDGWPCKNIGHLSYATSSFVHHFVAIGEYKLELQSGNAQSGSN